MTLTKFYNTNLPPHLRVLKDEIEGYARGYGLDFFETIFEVVDADDLNEIAAYGGFPTRYPHWSFGMQYEELKRSYEYGLSKIYEMVINNDPCYAYLMRCNHVVDQKLVMAHVYGHCLAPETKVETKNGPKLITDVKVGDEVLTHEGRYRKVRLVARREYTGEICRLTVAGSSEAVRITPEHPVYTMRPEYDQTPEGRAANELAAFLTMGYQSSIDLVPPPEMKGTEWVKAGEIVAGDTVVLAQPNGELKSHQVFAALREPYYGFVYNFSVEEDESYTLAAGFAVHNCDFFKHNAFFAHTTRKMMDEIANHGSRIRRYAERFGEDEVEAFMDRCQSIDDLIDIHSVAIKRRDDPNKFEIKPATDEDGEDAKPLKFKSKAYLDAFINPRGKEVDDDATVKSQPDAPSFPDHPEKDVLLFLIEHAPLKNWQRDVLSIVRDEAYYFYPQAQTKIMNEGWACVTSDTLVPTDRGFVPAGELVAQRIPATVADGSGRQTVYDWAKFTDRETVTILTRRGLKLGGSTTHRVVSGSGEWKRLDELAIGDRVKLARGTDLWATEPVRLNWKPAERLTVTDICQQAGVSMRTLYRHLDGKRVQKAAVLEPLVAQHRNELATGGMTILKKRRTVTIPTFVDERMGAFLGYLIGDGHISDVKRTLGLTTGDEPQADHFAGLVEELFGITPRRKWDETKWRIKFSSGTVRDFLVSLGLKTGFAAREKTVPECILRSPKAVVAAFLRALYDCDGYAGPHGVILATSSEQMSEVVQQLLLNFGVLSTRKLKKDGCWHVRTQGASAKVFGERIGFGLERKAKRLRMYVEHRNWFKEEPTDDEVVSIERGQADVFDFSVTETHRYAAAGFINHNSYWHSTIMTNKVLQSSELIDYADHHSGTMATSGRRLNPYKLGIELLRDVERRWNMGQFGPEWEQCDDADKRRTWDKQTGLGRQKIFEVRKVYNDITFIDTFLTPEFCREYKLFSFNYQQPTKNYVIESREFEQVKQRLLASLTNFGKPWIEVINGNHRNRGELLLRHRYSGVELKLNEAQDTLTNLRFIWGRPVHLETVIDDKPTLLSFDGQDHTKQVIGADNDPRRNPSQKPK